MREKFFHAIDHSDDVRTGLPLNIENDGRIAIGPGSLLGIFHAIDNRSDVGQPHRPAIAVSNDQRAVAVAGDKLIVCADGVGLVQAVKRPFGLVHVGLSKRRAQILKTQPVGSQRGRIRLDAYCRTLAATDADQPDTAELRNFLRKRGVREVFDFGQRKRFGGKRERQNGGIRGINLAVDGRIGEPLRQKIGSAIDGRLHLLFSDIDVQVQIKLQGDQRAPEGTRGSHLIQAGGLPELPFKRSGDRRSHDFGAGSRIERLHLNRGVIDLRQSRDR